MNNKKISTIISIILSIIFIIVLFFYLISLYKAKNIINNNEIIGIVEERKITLSEQYLYIFDKKNNKKIKILISENTIFKQKLALEKGDEIIIVGKKINENTFNANEISGLILQKN